MDEGVSAKNEESTNNGRVKPAQNDDTPRLTKIDWDTVPTTLKHNGCPPSDQNGR